MFSLFSTFFLVGLCCSSVITDTLDHKQIDNEISTPQNNVKYFNYNDEYGIQLYCNNADFMSYDFLSTFLFNLPTDTIDIKPDNTNTGSLEFNSDGIIYSYSNTTGLIDDVLDNIDSITLWKSSSSTINTSENSLIYCQYALSFYDNNTSEFSPLRLAYSFATVFPFVDTSEHDLGFSIVGVSNPITPSLATGGWYYFENSNSSSYTPIINYYYKVRKDEAITISNNSYQAGYSYGESIGYSKGYQIGLAEGLADSSYNDTANTIFNGIFTVAMLPVNVFLQFMNFEVFGINISGMISGLITIALVFIVLRFIFGSKGGKND